MVLQNPAFIGREAELNTLLKSMDSVFKRDGQVLFVVGEAGSGKSRLVNEFLSIVPQKEVNVLSGWCLSNASVPYFPFIEAFGPVFTNMQQLLARSSANMVSQIDWLSSHQLGGYGNEHRSPHVWMDLTFASITKELLNLSMEKPVILVLEDVHWADSASLALLHYISRFVNSERILVLATYRIEALSYNLEGQPSPLVEALRAMNREDLYSEIKLPSLSEVEVGLLALSMLGGQIQSTFVTKLFAESMGNPLFIVESLRTLRNEGCLIRENDEWSLFAEKIKVPSKVRDLILQRACYLKLKQRKILDVASVLGEKFDYKLIASVLCQEQTQVLEKLNSIARTTALIKFEDSSYSFDHAKSKEIIYNELPKPLKVNYHRTIAERLEALSWAERTRIAGDLAYHYEMAENPRKTLLYSLLAGEGALSKFSNLEAKRYFSKVLGLAGESKDYSNERIAALEGVGDASFAAAEFHEAKKIYEQLVNAGCDRFVKLRALRKAMESSRWLGDFTHSLELSGKAEHLKDANSLEYARVLLNKGATMGSSGNPKEALEALEQALAVFEEKRSLADLAQALNESASLYQTEGFSEKAILTAKRGIVLNEETGNLRGQVDAYFYAGQVFFNYRLYSESLTCFNNAMEIAEKIGYNNRTVWAALYSAIVLDIVGDLNVAITKNLIAVKYAEKTDSPYAQSQSLSNLLALYSKLSDIENAERCYRKIKDNFPDESKAGSRLGYSAMIKAQALFFAAKKEWVKSNELFNLSLDLLKGALFAKSFEATTRLAYAVTLDKQGRSIDADDQRAKASMLTKEVDGKFRDFSIAAAFVVKRESSVGEECEVRLDLVNVSRFEGFLIRVNNLFPSSFNVCKVPNNYVLSKGSLDFGKRLIESFQIYTIKASFASTKEGTYTFAPELVYEDRTANEKTIKLAPIKVIIAPTTQPNAELTEKATHVPVDVQFIAAPEPALEFQFNAESSRKFFDFLVKSFIEDYMRSMLPMEKAGWRTLMDAAKYGMVPVSAVYGRKGRLGRAVGELQRRGLIEMRFFSGERGRGGNIMKVRVCYEKDPVKRQIDLRVAGYKK